ncbi:alpha/beta-hydrolase [Stereum hirsutum FP-91666 SS1]|uniref:alpha/beta-hydrolase n=1 Tax=Stereum hirsutum (strain FP-91666) TaxID=721885 RepID=UPI000440F52E|nr:alpha/beta-hydrolase [Stereum hirsutum FP-91666 SS1]EIM92006.1 alpha/beta-hydrolase [Stereum hirsutum FP-91666 SS1]
MVGIVEGYIVPAQQYALLEQNRVTIQSVKRVTYSYGPTEGHKLDVYTPPASSESASAPSSKPPILLFFHGGSFMHGARIHPHQDLIHANLGAFFALKGILTVIVDYRLVPSVSFPGGSEDVHDALTWVFHHLNDVGDIDRIFLLGHSAGGVHVAGCLLSPSIYTRTVPIRGVILLGVPYEIPFANKTAAGLWEAAKVYYGGAKKVASNQPMGVLRRADNEWIGALPHLRNMAAAREPRYISSAIRTFGQLYASKGGIVHTSVMDGHDHLSPIFSLCSGQGEEWGTDIAEWIRDVMW